MSSNGDARPRFCDRSLTSVRIDVSVRRQPSPGLLANANVWRTYVAVRSPTVFAWAQRATITAYDAMHAAFDAPLLNRDRRLANALGRMIAVEMV